MERAIEEGAVKTLIATCGQNFLARSLGLCIGLLMMSFVTGCWAGQVERQEVLGLYRANHKQGNETLEFFENGRYVHTFVAVGKPTLQHEGSWTYERRAHGEIRLFLSEFIRAYRGPDSFLSPAPISWGSYVEKTWRGTIRIALEPDAGVYFIKQ